MIGPHPLGHWTGAGCKSALQHLAANRRYMVVSEFVDFDGHVHREGEAWTFLGASYLPYDDGQSLFVSPDGKSEWHIRLQWRPDAQGHILDHFERYVQLEEVG
ncbi:DUF3601 domain-containing protein [Sphingobium yanoikuyae]|jgi:Domain of unknown function (DUF3601)|uniref:DUF3601 domain-containing protein n=2 Tax=Sphingomonadaceae TaxID=41297 RepID=UPI0009B5F874